MLRLLRLLDTQQWLKDYPYEIITYLVQVLRLPVAHTAAPWHAIKGNAYRNITANHTTANAILVTLEFPVMLQVSHLPLPARPLALLLAQYLARMVNACR